MIQLVVEGKLGIEAEGQLELPKQPPFNVLTPGPAAIVHLELPPESPDCIRVFDHVYVRESVVDLIVHDGRGTWIRAMMRCTGLTWHKGIQITRAWSEPLRRATTERGESMFYRPTPRWQRIARDVHRYRLEAPRYARVPPVVFEEVRCLQ